MRSTLEFEMLGARFLPLWMMMGPLNRPGCKT